uniref:HAT C-terminal dimerisation domain-containing protein n=1 Tax=Astatotilapia calliptera TaxID=8154 RepID=A0A3P8NDG8_ASTCA
ENKGSTVVSTVATQQEGPEFNSTIRPGSFCVEFACSPRVCVGSLRVLRLPPTVQRHLAVCVRFVSCKGHVKECFLGLRKLERFDAQCITDTIEELLQYHTLSDLLCVAQSYDGASVMSGPVGGVQSRFRQRHREAVYVHCYAHELNLVLCHTCKAIPAASDFFGLLKNVYTFFNTSLVNHTKFKELQKDLGLFACELVQLSNTRWAGQVNSIKALLNNISAVLATLEATNTPIAKGILSKLSKPKTVYMLIMFSQLLGITEGLHRYLQGERLDMGKAVEYKMSVADTLSKLRTEAAAEEIFEKAMDICGSYNIQIHQGARHKQKRLEGFVLESRCGATPNLTSSAEFRYEIFFPCLDRMLQELADRFSGAGQKIMESIQACNPSSPTFLSEDALKPIAAHYHVTIKPEELVVAKNLMKRKMEKEDICDITTAFHLLDEDMFATLKVIFRIALTIPVSSCSCERSFSALRRLHMWLRRTMGQERLNDLAILSIENEYLDNVDPENVIDRFAKLKPRRYNLMLPQ